LQQAGLADMSHHGAESRLHKKLTEQQRWHGDEQSSVNAIVPQQGIQALEIQKGGEHKQRQPGDDDQNRDAPAGSNDSGGLARAPAALDKTGRHGQKKLQREYS
jgi:hypothetical protein